MMIDDHLRRVLAQRPCGLMTDIDGTISPLAPVPDEAIVTPTARQLLRQLADRLDLVAAISGRAAPVAARMVDLPELIYIGNHGMEVWQGDHAEPVAAAVAYVPTITRVLRDAQRQITMPGVIFEDKGVTATVHYRQAADHAAADQIVSAVLLPLARAAGVRLTKGHMVWEIRPPIEINKGTAAVDLIQQHGLRGAIFLGDDRTDADAFVLLRQLGEQGACVTLNIGVDAPETPQVVRDAADVLVTGVAGVEQTLGQMVALLGSHAA